MEIQDLSNISNEARRLINEHLEKTNTTVNALATDAGVHPTQLWLFIRSERGLTDSSLQKIGQAIERALKITK
jgi:plasmid maintenance system antidote protein VapI